MKVMTVVGTRPEIIKLSRVIAKLDQHVNHILVHTGQNFDYELNQIFFNELEIRKPDYFLDAVIGNQSQDSIKARPPSATETIAQILIKIDAVFEKENPEALLVYGDTNSCLCVVAAKKRKIPIFHMEAGNRCFDQRVPEEINRKIVDHLSDINMPLSEQARQYLLNEGLPPEQIIKTGSSMPEVLLFFKDKILASKILSQNNLKSKDFIVVSLHREENVDYSNNLIDIIKSLKLMNTTFKKKILVSTHPRTQKKLEQLKEHLKEQPLSDSHGAQNPSDLFDFDSNEIQFLKPFGFFDYIFLQQNAFCVVSDSGTITEEASILKFPAITIRQAHERPEGMDHGVLIMSGTDPEHVIASIKAALSSQVINDISDYNQLNVSDSVLKIILSYTHYINRFVWRKMI